MKENGEIIAEGDTLNEISNITVGKYKVELTSQNDCSLEQEVTVFAAQLPEITNIDVTGNTATVYVSGGNPGYEYSMDGTNFTSSNIFANIPRGLHTMYVRDSKKCEIIEKQFLVINLINVITPNNDGFNDVLDYSDLKIKENVSIEIFDRYGNLVFQSSDKNYIWDGTTNGKALPTGNYWYILNWIEPDTKLPVSYKGWILLKNRN
ncbi:T9SS type B sorting domain-containing protein [Kaistella anthropi]|nr:T9SS type B sorting domain-containing protein [Kaistella anthropi]